MRSWLLALVFLLGSNSPGFTQPIAIQNPGFEANVINPGTFIVLFPTGWNTYDPGNIINQNANSVGVIYPTLGQSFFPGGSPQANNSALVFLAGPVNFEAGLQQTLTATLQPFTRYTLSVQVGNIASGTSIAGSSDGGGIFYDLDGFPGYRIDLLAGGSVIASDNNSLGALIPEGQFRLSTVNFETGASHANMGQNLGIRLVNLDIPGTQAAPNIEVDFDDVRLNAAAIPEPSTLLLGGFVLLVAGTGYCIRRARSRNQLLNVVEAE